MAKKQSKDDARVNVFSIRGSREWRDWVIAYAASRRVPVASLFDQVLAEAAKRDGFAPPPPR